MEGIDVNHWSITSSPHNTIFNTNIHTLLPPLPPLTPSPSSSDRFLNKTSPHSCHKHATAPPPHDHNPRTPDALTAHRSRHRPPLPPSPPVPALAAAPAVEIVALGRARFVAQRCNEDGKAKADSDVEHGLEDVGQRQRLVADGGGERLASNDEEERAGAGFEGKEEDLEATRGEVHFRLETYIYRQ